MFPLDLPCYYYFLYRAPHVKALSCENVFHKRDGASGCDTANSLKEAFLPPL